MKISVIIPAYNAEKFLTETLESVLNQTLDEYEVLVTNDGSKDSTLDILREYEKNYLNMKVIDKENEGVSAARNDGLDIACGEYVFFFDADDVLELDALEELYKRAESLKADVVIAGYDIFDNYTTTEVKDLEELLEQDNIEKYDDRILWTFSLSNKLLRKQIIDDNHFRFPPISYSEDGAFLMNYIYHSKKITGLDKVVFHYRRLNGEGNAITETISDGKIADYITAHKIILESAENAILRDFSRYKNIREAKQNNRWMIDYLNSIIRKELNILMKQFYAKFWSLEERTISRIVEEVNDKLRMIDMKTLSLIVDDNPDLKVLNLDTKKADMLNNSCLFTAALYGEEKDKREFLISLKSITVQSLVGIKIILPVKMKAFVEDEGLLYENMIFVDADGQNVLFQKALEMGDTQYIVFCDSKILYANNAFKYIFKRFIKGDKNFITELVYHNNFGEAQPVYYNRIAQESVSIGMEYNPYLQFDALLANKFFRAKFLKNMQIDWTRELKSYIKEFYEKGCYVFFNDGIVIYNDLEKSFLDYVGGKEARKLAEDYYTDKPVTLDSTDVLINPAEAFAKLQDIEPETLGERVMVKTIPYVMKKKVEDKILFITIRKNGELEGNAKALYPYIEGKKVIFAKKLPHNPLSIIKAMKLIATSKVIVTDDYVKYLRYFPLKSDQRVIQLWHACGAFKKFGQRGTNMSVKTDNATHAQYNLVCVSGTHIRPIYADAFNINMKKVKALGCPRTDDFFNRELIEEKKQEIYNKYPDLKDKFIIIYAPTFRDIGEGRTVFRPQIDFDRLSKNLLPNQQFIICPHPVMKNSIISKRYSNIKVIRDFSTNDLMFISNMLVTDYSSVIFEYALLKKPIAFFCYDLTTYNRGFYLQYPDDLPGEVYENQDELEYYFTHPDEQVITDRYDRFVERYMTGCDGKSCERISGLINSYMEGK